MYFLSSKYLVSCFFKNIVYTATHKGNPDVINLSACAYMLSSNTKKLLKNVLLAVYNSISQNY